ncbi:MAG: sugar ABC transporter permease [Bacteroidetes bacterium]|nr:sugar ABC transporter permease [Bacteroidota bacterium]
MKNPTRRHALIGYAFLLPNIIGFLLFTFGPIVFSFFVSFFDWNLFSTPTFVDTANYRTMFTSPGSHFWDYFGNTLFFLIVVPVQMTIALATAYLLNENLRGNLLFKAIFFIPLVLSVVSIAIVWEYILDTENGLLNHLLAFLGAGKIPWLFDPFWAKVGISLMVVWQGSAFGTIIYYAALQGIPDQLYEVARLDGASRLRQFWSITVPLLGPTHFFLSVTGFIASLQLFAPIYVMTHGTAGGAHNIIFEIYWKAYHEFQMGYASALSWVLFILIFILTAIYWKYLGKKAEYA